jgi:glyoxylase-like metal-dependent hydrolase (beta-lactamase superfamily II)
METKTRSRPVARSEDYFRVAPDVWGMKNVMVNVYMIAYQEGELDAWALVDAGLSSSPEHIFRMAEDLFGKGTRPSAIILTHGHADHVGGLKEILGRWDVPVYAHRLEIPFVKGKSAYPPSDPFAGGGIMPFMAWAFSRRPVQLTSVKEISSAVLPGWSVVHTPGHTPGHISLYRERDRVLIAGDAFVTTQQESLLSIVMQSRKLCGPPRYYTIDWIQAEKSVKRLAALEPRIAATGHGKPMKGKRLQRELHELADNFKERAVPLLGRYVPRPALADERGIVYVPPLRTAALAAVGGVLLGIITLISVFRTISWRYSTA